MGSVLVVDDDRQFLRYADRILRMSGFTVRIADRAHTALLMAQDSPPALMITDLHLPDLSGVELIRQLRASEPSLRGVKAIIITGFGSMESAIRAIRVGACDYVEKPLGPEDLIKLVASHLSARGDGNDLPPSEAHAARRWAEAVVQVIDAPNDPKQLSMWGQTIAASTGALRNWCRTAGIAPKRSLDFARVLRAVIRQRNEHRTPEQLLDVVDRRTLSKLLRLGDGTSEAVQLPCDVEEFLTKQRWIGNESAIESIRTVLGVRLANRGRSLASGPWADS